MNNKYSSKIKLKPHWHNLKLVIVSKPRGGMAHWDTGKVPGESILILKLSADVLRLQII